jgi:hypothetical protein
MEISKTKLAAGDTSELLKLARSIKASKPRDRNANPLASQFFDPDPSNIRPLSTDDLVSSLAGSVFNEKVQQVEDLVFQQKVREQYPALGSVPKPSVGGDVSEIGVGAGRSASKEITVTAKAALAGKLEKAFSRLSPDQRAAFVKAEPSTTCDSILTETLKSIVTQLLGAGLEHFDPATLKIRIAKAVEANPVLGKRLTKALQAA